MVTVTRRAELQHRLVLLRARIAYVPETLALNVEAEFDVLVPFASVPCQYQVTPVGGVPRVIVFAPQVFVETVGEPGCDGFVAMVTTIEAPNSLQHCVELLYALT